MEYIACHVFLKAMYKEVGEHSKLSDMIIEKISKLKFHKSQETCI